MHIHSVLSPCGDLEMGPKNIVQAALDNKLDIIAITDHNSTKMCKVVQKVASQYGITVIPGVEVTTKEEVHCLAYFHNFEQVDVFQAYLEANLPFFQNNVDYFGYQVVVDENDNILEEIETLLINGLNASIEEVEQKVHELGGVFIPAHINKTKNSIISQLGFIPLDLKIDALELSKFTDPEKFTTTNPHYSKYTYVQNSDAHFIDNIGDIYTIFELNNPRLDEIVDAFQGKNNRKIVSYGTKA